MADDRARSTITEGRFEKVLAEILMAEEAGKTIDLSEVLRRHPELATQLREYFRNRDCFDGVAEHLAPAGSRPPVPTDLIPDSEFAGYKIIRVLGRGGMGIVYAARQLSPKRPVALKLMRIDRLAHLSPQRRKEWLIRFRNERETAARIVDDRVVTVYEVGTHEGRPFYSMRFVAGRSLADILETGRLANRPAAILMEQVALAVQVIHEGGVLHRDLKPHNILVDAKGRPYVSDFGLAKCLDAVDSPTDTGDALGSPPYMSPEQVRDAAHVTEATDVYGLGAILYTALTGRPPFQGKTAHDILDQVKYRDPVPPRRVNPDVDLDLNVITLKCLVKEPSRRFTTAAEVANELRRYLDGRPIKTRPIGPVGRLERWSRRNPVVTALSAAAVVLLGVTGALYWGFWSRGQEIDQVQAKGEQTVAQVKEAGKIVAQDKKYLEYLEGMGRVKKQVDGNEFTEARDVLALWEPREGEPDYRGWEWHFLKAQCRGAPFTVRGHNGPVQAVAWSPDGTRLASADQQGVVKIWDVANSKEVQSFNVQALNFQGLGVMGLAWSSDGKLLAAAGPKTVQIWEADSGNLSQTLQQAANIHLRAGMPTPPNATPEENAAANARQLFRFSQTALLIWNPRSEKLALADTDGKLQIWDLSAATKDPLVIRAHEGGVHSAAWSPNGSRLASISYEAVIKIWDTASDRPLFTSAPILPVDEFMPVNHALCWSKDGKRLNVVSGKAWLGSMDVGSGEVAPLPKLEAYDPLVRNGLTGTGPRWFTWSPNGKALATVSTGLNSSVSFWDVATGKEGPPILKAGDAKPMIPMMTGGCPPAWDASGRRLAVGWGDGTIQTVRPGPNRDAVRSSHGALAWSRDSKRLWGGPDTLAAATEAFKGARDQVLDDLHKSLQGGITAPPDPSRHLRGGGFLDQRPAHQIQVSDAVTGTVLQKFGNGKAPGASLPTMLAESPDGKWLASVADPIQLWATAGGDQPVTLNEERGARQGPGGRILLAWNPKSNQLAATSLRDNAVRLWDPETRTAVQSLNGHDKPVRSLVWSADGRRLAWADDGGTIRIWEAAAGKEIPPLTYYVKSSRAVGQPRPAAPSTLAWCPDGTRLAVAGEDELVHIWDVDAGKELAGLHGHPATVAINQAVGAVAWSPDGKRLASASPDGTFSLWDTATWKEILVLRLRPVAGRLAQLGPSAAALEWSPDGQQLAFFGGGSGAIWDATPEEGPGGQEARGPNPARAQEKVEPNPTKDEVPVKPAIEMPGQQVADESGAVTALERVGAGIRRDEKQPGKPVVWVDLTQKTQVTDADLKGLKNLKSLQMLNLGLTQVTDACLEELRDLKSLHTLNIPFTKVTDEGLKYLKDLQQLQILNLAVTRVTDTGLRSLKGLKSLRLLDLTRTQVTEVGLKDIKEALPQCQVIKEPAGKDVKAVNKGKDTAKNKKKPQGKTGADERARPKERPLDHDERAATLKLRAAKELVGVDKKERAKQVLDALLAKYPKSEAANEAKELLEKLKD
jgi:WD40 repeat protein